MTCSSSPQFLDGNERNVRDIVHQQKQNSTFPRISAESKLFLDVNEPDDDEYDDAICDLTNNAPAKFAEILQPERRATTIKSTKNYLIEFSLTTMLIIKQKNLSDLCVESVMFGCFLGAILC